MKKEEGLLELRKRGRMARALQGRELILGGQVNEDGTE